MNEPTTAPTDYRRPTAAGTFYPAHPVELTKSIASLFAKTEKAALGSRPLALVVPHSGFAYSGAVAARAFKLLEGEQYETVIIVAPAHAMFFEGVSVFQGRGYSTPLGEIDTDSSLAARIAGLHPKIFGSAMGHATGATRGEHAIEVLLPFLQIALGRFRLVAIMMGEQDESVSRALGDILATCATPNTLLLASTDLSHFHPEQQARTLDSGIRHAVESGDVSALFSLLESGKAEACGGGGLAAVMLAARRLGGASAQILDYTTSGTVTGDFADVVGYLSAVIAAERPEKQKGTGVPRRAERAKYIEDLTPADLEFLRTQAAGAIQARFDGREWKPESRDNLAASFGVFATLSPDGRPRESFGRLRPEMPLYEAVPMIAAAAVFDDPRQSALSAEEFSRTSLSLSIISPLIRISDPADYRAGSDGLLLRLDMHTALLLPAQIARRGWRQPAVFEELALLAGLPRSGYQDRLAELYRFTVVSF